MINVVRQSAGGTAGAEGEQEGNPSLVECRAELERVLRSETFHKAPRLCSLLLYVCENTLAGRVEELTEQQIGIHVFHRAPGYSSGDDTIVRGTARHLRSRLEQYYWEAGETDPIRLTVPKGGYVAAFNRQRVEEPLPIRSEAALAEIPLPTAVMASAVASPAAGGGEKRQGWPATARLAVMALVLSLVGASVALWLATRREAPRAEAVGPMILWRSLFSSGRRTLIVPGDAALDSYVAWEQRPVSLQNYSNQTYQGEVTVSRPPSTKDVPLSVRSVTPMADLRMTAELMRVQFRMGEETRTEIRYARDLTVNETHNANLILMGSETFNPWITVYEPLLDFGVHWDPKTDVYTVLNRAPKEGEAGVLEYRRSQPESRALTSVAYLENPQGQGNVLLIQGTSMGTTYGALNFLTSERLWKPAITAATDGNGHLHSFEVLLENDFVRGGVANTRLRAMHVH